MLPYLVLCVSWALANPAGAAADEHDNMVKILAAARFDIGTKYEGPASDVLTQIRNDSIARVVLVPANLAVSDEFFCTAFQPNQTADCLPTGSVGATGMVEQKTVMARLSDLLLRAVWVGRPCSPTTRRRPTTWPGWPKWRCA